MEEQPEKNNLTTDEEIIGNKPFAKIKSFFEKILTEYKSILLFLPLILIVSSDDTTLIVNEVIIVADFHLETTMASFGALLAVSQILKAFSMITFGFLSDKYKRKNLLIIATLVWFIGDILVSFSNQFWQLFLFRVIASAAAGAVSAIALSLLAD